MSDASLKTAGLKLTGIAPHSHAIADISGLLGALNSRLRTDSAARNLIRKQGGVANLANRTSSGTYTGTQNEATQARGWPVDAASGEKWIALVLTHGADTEYRSLQWAAKLGSEEIWYRSISRSSTTGANTATVPWTNHLAATTPLGAGTAAIGTSTSAARADHRHPSTAATPATDDDSTAIATTAWVRAQGYSAGGGGSGGYSPHFRAVEPPPVVSTWTWVNQGTATAADVTDALDQNTILLTAIATSSDNLRLLSKALPGSSWTMTALLCFGLPAVNYAVAGVFVRNSSSGKLATWARSNESAHLWKTRWNSPTAFYVNTSCPIRIADTYWIKLVSDGTSIKAYSSPDGVCWAYAGASGDEPIYGHLVSPTDVGIYANSSVSNLDAVVRLLSWELS